MRKLGTLKPEFDYVSRAGAFWYLVGYFADQELPDSFFERFVTSKRSQVEFKRLGQEAREKIQLLKEEFTKEESPHADTRPNR